MDAAGTGLRRDLPVVVNEKFGTSSMAGRYAALHFQPQVFVPNGACFLGLLDAQLHRFNACRQHLLQALGAVHNGVQVE